MFHEKFKSKKEIIDVSNVLSLPYLIELQKDVNDIIKIHKDNFFLKATEFMNAKNFEEIKPFNWDE